MYDCIIIGTGPAGLSAAINLKTYKKDFLWFGTEKLSTKIIKAEKVTNYPGFPEISGQKLAERFQEHRKSMDISITEKTVTNVMAAGDYFMVLADNEIYEARSLILAMGVMEAKMNLMLKNLLWNCQIKVLNHRFLSRRIGKISIPKNFMWLQQVYV